MITEDTIRSRHGSLGVRQPGRKAVDPPTTVPMPRARCKVCKSPDRIQIEALLGSGMQLGQIEDELRKVGRPTKRETIGRHFRICLGGNRPTFTADSAQSIADASRVAASEAERDFASMVQRRAVQLLANGDLKVSTKDGLQAQQLLDRRAEKAADRDLSLNLARLLSGAITPAPPVVIEGRVVVLPDDGLAPLALVDPDR